MTTGRPPSVDALVREIDDGRVPRPILVETVREVIEAWRNDERVDIEAEARSQVDRIVQSAPRRIVNATGVILHTNLGRAPWSPAALTAATEVAPGYANVELDVTTGERGRRNDAAERLAVTLTGAEAALVVNNNAGAVLLTLLALASGRNVPVSRGELIEIGGSYRLPELMAATGAHLVEVGTTNRTRTADYAAVDDPALLLKVHPSNYRVVGFAESASTEQLARLAAERGIPLAYDVGSGLIDESVPWLEGPPPEWLQDEPGVRQALSDGADLVLFSGDKLLGGPQAGVVVGRAELVTRLSRHPAARALRVDGPTTAALAATFTSYLAGQAHDLPVWKMASLSPDSIAERARSVISGSGARGDVVEGFSTLGAGSSPGAEIPTALIKLPHGDQLHAALLAGNPPILCRREAGSLVIDLRTVDPADDGALVGALAGAI